MSQVIWVIQANMAQTNPTLNDYVQGQAGAQAQAAAAATTIVVNAITALTLGTASTHAAGDFSTAAQGALATTALQSFTETDPVVSPLLSAHAALTTSAHGGIIGASDSRMTNSRTPTAHATTHLSGGSDPLSESFDPLGAASTAQAFSIQRANHTGTQTASTISNFSTAALAAVTWSTLTGKPTFANVATSGAYSDLSGAPALGTQMSVDSGWTANSTAGDKTAALSSYSNGINSTIITALNLAAANSGTAIGALGDIVVTLVKQVAALRTALIAAKLPNV